MTRSCCAEEVRHPWHAGFVPSPKAAFSGATVVLLDRIQLQNQAVLRHGDGTGRDGRLTMLAITTCDRSYVDACHKRVKASLAKYRKLEQAAAGIDGFQADMFAHMDREAPTIPRCEMSLPELVRIANPCDGLAGCPAPPS
jgi:hypothetical protein